MARRGSPSGRGSRSGIELTLVGEANDYAGKGLSGAWSRSGLRTEPASLAEENVIVGNTVLYGATAGKAFFRGTRRRAVRTFAIPARRPSSRASATTAAST